MDPMKVHGVMEWPTPMKVKEVQSFLGFVNFYQKFICDFSNIAYPLYALTHKTQQWVWGSALCVHYQWDTVVKKSGEGKGFLVFLVLLF